MYCRDLPAPTSCWVLICVRQDQRHHWWAGSHTLVTITSMFGIIVTRYRCASGSTSPVSGYSPILPLNHWLYYHFFFQELVPARISRWSQDRAAASLNLQVTALLICSRCGSQRQTNSLKVSVLGSLKWATLSGVLYDTNRTTTWHK